MSDTAFPSSRAAHGPLPSLMAQLAAANATGVLVTTSDSAHREIVFVNGEIRAARSHVEDEKLGKWLVERQRISEDDRALTLLAQGGADSPPLGHLLVTRGAIERELLERELQELSMTIIQRAAAAGAPAEFLDGESSDQPDTLPDLFTRKIILAAARAVEDVVAKRRAIGELRQFVLPASDLEHLLDDFNLTPTEGFLLSRLDDTRTISGLIKVSALPDDQVVTTLYPLIVAGIVRLADEAPAGSGRRPAPVPTVAQVQPVDESALSDAQRQERKTVMRRAEEITRVDHYRALDLRPGAPADDVAVAWARAQSRYDPRRAGEPHLRDLKAQLEGILERAREAHEVLSSVRDRRRYDRILRDVENERKSLAGRGRGETDASVRSAIVEANLKRADELIHDGELYLAIQLLEQACALEPRPGELVKLARLLLRNPLWTNRALSCMRRAIQIDANSVEAWLELASFWRRRRNAERERKALEKALAADPENATAIQMYRDLMGKRELDRLLRRAQQERG